MNISLCDFSNAIFSHEQSINRKTTTQMKKQVLGLILIMFIYSCNSSDAPAPTGNVDSMNTISANALSDSASIEKGFDINSVPISDKELATFPYFNLPQGYQSVVNHRPKDFDRFPFWVGDHFEWVEGKIFSNYIREKEGKEFSGYEVLKYLDNEITIAGAVQVFKGEIPSDSSHWLNDHFNPLIVNYVDGLGDVYNDPASTYVIHRKDKIIWIHLCIGSMSGGWIILDQIPRDKAKP